MIKKEFSFPGLEDFEQKRDSFLSSFGGSQKEKERIVDLTKNVFAALLDKCRNEFGMSLAQFIQQQKQRKVSTYMILRQLDLTPDEIISKSRETNALWIAYIEEMIEIAIYLDM